MSLILDALNRSEQERRENTATPDIFVTQRHSEPTEATWVVRYRLLILSVCALVCLALLGYYWPDSAVDLAAPEQNEPFFSEQSSVVEKPVVAVNPVGTNKAKPSEQVASLYLEPKAKSDAAEQVPTVIKPELGSAPETSLLPLLVELSESVKNRIPSIYYSMHIYSEDGKDNFVVLNGEATRIGELVSDSLRLSAIHEEHIELEFQGDTFRLQALNSWVNL
ncbi:MAG: hypothetical protein ACI9GW_001312 [Halieaceae bacterium]|jgi:hypothetical protein